MTSPLDIPRLVRLSPARAVIAALVVVAGCSTDSGPSARPDVLLLTIDTLRADHWGCLGDPSARTPGLDRLSRGATLAFEGRAPAPITLPSHTSIMMGVPPAVHGIRDNGIFRLPADQGTTLAEALGRAGWSTTAFVSAYPLSKSFGLDRGFDHYDSNLGASARELGGMRQRPAGATVDRVRKWLGGGRWVPPDPETPAFTWVHLFDPHAEYEAPEPWTDACAGDPYAAEIAYVDRQVKILLREWHAARGAHQLLIVVAADHGEGLWEHGESTHGALIHATTIRVPIVFDPPGYAPRLLPEPRALERIPASILSVLGLDPELNRGAAPPLAAATTPVHAETLYPFFNFGWSGLRAREENGWRLISGPVDRLYHLAEDPGETRDVASRYPDRVASMKDALEREWEARDARAFARERHALSESEAEALQALGYVAGGDAGTALDGAFTSGDDPQARLPLVDRINYGLTLLRNGRPEEAVDVLKNVIDADPRNRFAYRYLGQAAHEAGRFREAAAAFRRALELGPNPDLVYRDLARSETALGNLGAAREVLLKALRLNPKSAETRNRLGGIYVLQHRLELAREQFLLAVDVRPHYAEAWANLGAASAALGRREEAKDAWTRVLDLSGDGRLSERARASLKRLSEEGGTG